ncbi:IMPACT family protein [Robertkochia solimangrovi]|uniref:IMPACT family protein n=1 Tax=Robertkochia solimangrovi TaxID=2213046 RepID=UPI00117C1A2B|nr:YigZ family protein [Robertkochia solimangrovi]TRZ41061.1 YigZ family protein [Robertkochia solimangrovi]
MNDSYKTIDGNSEEVLFKEKGSKFFGYAYHVSDEEAISDILDSLRAKHHSARHWCYAWQLGEEEFRYRANDDGEPSNSAGMPIYGQIQSFELTNVLIVVVRYFGGIKLGVGGLISAYKTTAQMALESSPIIEKTINRCFRIQFGYPDMNKVMRIIKERNLEITDQKMDLTCEMTVSTRKGDVGKLLNDFEPHHQIILNSVDCHSTS